MTEPNWSRANQRFFNPAIAPIKPITNQQLCPDWKPSSLVITNVPLSGKLANPKALKFVLDFLFKFVSKRPFEMA